MPSVTVELPRSDRAPAEARHVLASVIPDFCRPENFDVALLLVGELVANVIRHTASDARLTVNLEDGCLRCIVHDASPTHPSPRDPPTDAPSGRGLLLVAALADSWGSDDDPPGKSVWFELRT